VKKHIALRTSRASVVFVAALLAVVVAACGSSGSTGSGSSGSGSPASASSPSASSSDSSSSGGVYNLPLITPQGPINPLTTADADAMYIVGLASAQLVDENTSGTLVPQLATKWDVSSNGLSWTFTLRPGAKFSNGKPVTPADVVWTVDQIIAPKSQSPAASGFAGILKSVKAGSGNTVVFTLAKPYSDFPYLLTGANTWILPQGTALNTWINHPVGAGQFVLEKYTPGQGATYKKNPDYWDASAVKLSEIDAKFFSSLQSELLAFQSGEVDQVNGTGITPKLVGSAPHRVDTAGWTKFDGFVFNVTQPPFNNVKVRQAIAWALNRQEIVSAAYQGQAVVGNDIPTFPNYSVQPQGIPQRSSNLATVKQLLTGVQTPISFTITTYTDEQTLAQSIQQQLEATGDFKVNIDALSEGAYYAGSNSTTPWLNAPATITDWAVRLPSQLQALLYAKGAVWNASHYVSPQLDSLTSQYEATTDPATRQTLANQIAKIEYTDVPVIITAFQKSVLILSPKVQGSFTNGQDFYGGFDFRGISVGS
jgi:peptide/nickel transport system substrate-binding protein